MKVCVVLVALAAFVAAEPLKRIDPEELTAYGYHTKIGIPEAERIRKMEEEGSNAMSRILGGEAAVLGQFRYQAGLVIDLIGFSGNGVCGSSLLTSNRLLTAAHCWFDGENQAWRFTVVLGSTTLFYGGTRIQSSDVRMHEDWNPSLIKNDVAIIYLPETVTFTATIAPIELPSGSELTETYAGEDGVASGFGLNVSPGGSISLNQFLSWVEMPIMTNSACWWWFFGNIDDGMICTSGANAKSTCGGDSGGPLVVTRNNRQILIGVVSFGIGLGCHAGWPAVFARTTYYADWIRSHL